MPRYLVERMFPQGLTIPISEDGVKGSPSGGGHQWQRRGDLAALIRVDRQAQDVCVYDGPSPDAIQTVANKNGLPVDSIVEVRVLDPYFYR